MQVTEGEKFGYSVPSAQSFRSLPNPGSRTDLLQKAGPLVPGRELGQCAPHRHVLPRQATGGDEGHVGVLGDSDTDRRRSACGAGPSTAVLEWVGGAGPCLEARLLQEVAKLGNNLLEAFLLPAHLRAK